MIDLIVKFAVACVGMFFLAWFAVKFFIYGGLATGALWLAYVVSPNHVGTTVTDMMVPRLIDLWFIYPKFITLMFSTGTAEHGILGTIIYSVVGIGLFIPYISGTIAGFLFWPFLKILL